MPAELSRIKEDLRRDAKNARMMMTDTDRERYSRRICDRIRASDPYRSCRALLIYAPLPDEPDLIPVAEEALTEGKEVYFPKCSEQAPVMSFFRVAHISDLYPGRFGIPEPAGLPGTEWRGEECRSFCLVPGLAFDRAGSRIGYGGGFYDRFLRDYPVFSAGVCFQAQLRPFLPAEVHDRRVRMIVTEEEVIVT